MNKINDSSDTSFDQYFESTAEHDILLALHRTVPPALVILNCVGSASTLAMTSRLSMGSAKIPRLSCPVLFVLFYRSDVSEESMILFTVIYLSTR